MPVSPVLPVGGGGAAEAAQQHSLCAKQRGVNWGKQTNSHKFSYN